jgi:hypothetical protein
MDAAGKIDEVVPVVTRWQPSKSSTTPLLFQNEDRAVLIFTAGREPLREGIKTVLKNASGPSDVVPGGKSGRVEIQFEDCLLTKFGYPGFSALPGHPLYARGLNGYGLYEVQGSSWTDRLAEQDKLPFPKERWPPFPARHFVATFKDVIFECLCSSVRGRSTNRSVAEILEQLIR